jgi:ATP-dependent DNA helicase RecQ
VATRASDTKPHDRSGKTDATDRGSNGDRSTKDSSSWPTPAGGRHRPTAASIRRVAREKLGFDSLRPGQVEATREVLAGRDTLAVLPTGAGKSAIHQIAADLIDGPTVVVSPLLALQRDQVKALEDRELGAAAELNSAITTRERRAVFDELTQGELEFVFLAPEQLGNEAVLASLRAAHPRLFVVDEAHCVSEWGHDFRPDYLRLGTVIEGLGHPTTLALTATAAPPVRREIAERLRLDKPAVIVQGFDRPNIRLGVEAFVEGRDDPGAKREALIDRVARTPGSGIVYAATRRATEELADRGVSAAAYHAGMNVAARERVQEAFMGGETAVIVATTAFGMGIDKPDVRFVFHHDIGESVDAYYQELGRAGRDGEPAEAVLFYDEDDLNLRRFFAGGGGLDQDEVLRVAAAVRDHGPVTPVALRDEMGMSETRLTRALNRLEEVNAVALLPTGEAVPDGRRGDLEEITAAAMTAQANQRRFARSRLDMMRGYAETRGCRRDYLFNYFGGDLRGPCGRCDNCDAGLVAPEAQTDDERFPIESGVVHRAWGDDQVMRHEEDKIVVLFATVGYRTLDCDLVTVEGLLTARP